MLASLKRPAPTCRPGPIRAAVVAGVAAAALVFCRRSAAHEGPPFPILMDQPVADSVVSVWADPDIGEAQFFIIVESPAGGPPTHAPDVSMWVEPVSGRLDRVDYPAEKTPQRSHLQFEAHPHFDQRDMWTVGFQLTAPGGEPQELTAQVESTPPGFGAWDFVLYLFPFALLGGMWVLAIVRRSRALRQLPGQPESSAQAPEHEGGA